MAASSDTKSERDEFVIARTFDAPRDLMWKVWTEPEHMAKWFGPKGTTNRSIKHDFRPGGIYHYALELPNGDVMWGKWMFREIVPPERLVYINAFSDENGGLTRHPMAPDWPEQMLAVITFDEKDGKTTVTIRWRPYEATEAERKVFTDNFDSMRGGWGGTFEQLAEYLAEQQR